MANEKCELVCCFLKLSGYQLSSLLQGFQIGLEVASGRSAGFTQDVVSTTTKVKVVSNQSEVLRVDFYEL